MTANYVVRTVLGPVPADELGVTLTNETLLSVFPGAELAPDISMNQSEIFATLKEKLEDFRRAGGQTIVDTSGMFHGRDPWMYRTLSQVTGVHIIASTGLGPEKLLGGYFTTPQSNPPTPWPAEKFAGLFIKEIEEGMVVPRVERAGFPGIVTSIAERTGITEIEANLFQACALTAEATGVPISVQYGATPEEDLAIITASGTAANRVVVTGLDRKEATDEQRLAVAKAGAYVGISYIGWGEEHGYVQDNERVRIIQTLIKAGYAERILLSSSATGVAKGHDVKNLSFADVLICFVPQLREAGVTDAHIDTLLVQNPQRFLATVDGYDVANTETAWQQIFSPVQF